jgi:Tol biopolymer transport system component
MSAATLVYRTNAQDSQLTWVDRGGRRQTTVGEPGQYTGVALSPDGTRVAVLRENRLNRADADIWIVDLQRGTTARFTTDPLVEPVPTWSADGESVIYVTGHDGGNIWRQPISGAARYALVLQSPSISFRINSILTSLHATPDGCFVLFEAENRGGATREDVWRVPTSGDATPSIVLGQPFNEGPAAVSPDGQWIAYVSNESGVDEVFLSRWNALTATAGSATLVSRGGATAPRWRRDSRELFYQSAGRIVAVPVTGDRIGEPVPSFDAPSLAAQWAEETFSRAGERCAEQHGAGTLSAK